MPTGERMEEGRARANCEGRNSRRSRGKTAPFDAIAEGESRIQRERKAQAPTMDMIETSRVEGIFSSATLPWIAESFFAGVENAESARGYTQPITARVMGITALDLATFRFTEGGSTSAIWEFVDLVGSDLVKLRNTRSARQIGVF